MIKNLHKGINYHSSLHGWIKLQRHTASLGMSNRKYSIEKMWLYDLKTTCKCVYRAGTRFALLLSLKPTTWQLFSLRVLWIPCHLQRNKYIKRSKFKINNPTKSHQEDIQENLLTINEPVKNIQDKMLYIANRVKRSELSWRNRFEMILGQCWLLLWTFQKFNRKDCHIDFTLCDLQCDFTPGMRPL